ncbi:MAG: ABC transporter substrate-binding protein [Elusimicrobiota bacterium]|nr:ABC transporter substrate-binding protein [Elusimicrobiota bacterium]
MAALVVFGGFGLAVAAENKKTTLHILALLPLTGPGKSLGEFLQNGIEMGRVEAGKRTRGAVTVEVEYHDSKNQPQEGVSALQAALAKSRPDAVIAAMSSVAKAVLPVLEEQGILTIVTTTALTDLPKGTKHVIRVYPTSRDYVESVAKHVAKKFQRVAILYVNDDFGQSNQKVFASIVKDAGKVLAASEPFGLQQADARPAIERVLAAKPEAVFVTGYGPAFVTVFKQLRELKGDLPIFTEIGFANPTILAELGQSADGITFNGTALELMASGNKSSEKFRKQYRAQFKNDPYMVAGFAYDSVLMLAEAALKAKPMGKPDKPGVIALSPFNGAMGTILLDGEGECSVPLMLMRREKGRTVKARD